MQMANLTYLSTGEPTYWPSDRRKMPDLIDFAVVQQIPMNTLQAETSLDLSSDHSPVVITITLRPVPNPRTPTVSTSRTDWETFCLLICQTLHSQVPLKTPQEIYDFTQHLTQTIQQAAWNATPPPNTPLYKNSCAQTIKQKS